MGNSGNIGEKIKDFFIGVGKFLLKTATTAILSRIATRVTGTPVLGRSLADAINSLYAVGSSDLGKGNKDIDVIKINKQIMDALPHETKFDQINSPAELLVLVKEFPKEARKAGIKESDIPMGSASGSAIYAVGSADLSKGGKDSMEVKKVAKKVAKKEQVPQGPSIAYMAKGGSIKKARSPAQIAATKRMLAALAKYKASKK